MKAQEYKELYDTLDRDFGNFSWHLQEVADYIYPRRALFSVRKTKGGKRNLVYDSSPIHMNALLAAGLHGMMTNPSLKWFSLRPVDDSLAGVREVQVWLDQVEKIMYAEINRPEAGFSTAMHEFYMEYCAFGTAVLFVADSKGVLRFRARSLTECRFSENGDGVVDVLARKFTLKPKQILDLWGRPVSMKRADPNRDVEVIHVVRPGKRGFESVYIVENEIADKGMFEEFPFMVGRFYRAPDETYGRSPGTEALPYIKLLNEMMKTTIKAAQKIVDPPLMLPDDGFLGPVRVAPGGLNYYRAGMTDRIEPLLTRGDIPVSLEMMNQVRDEIRNSFFIDQLQLGNRPQMTATEAIQRTEDRLRLLGPVLGRMQSEVLGPMIDRVFAILVRNKKLPPPPEIAGGGDLTVRYESPIAKAQEQIEANGVMRMLEVLVPLIDRKPEMMDVFDGDYLARHVGDMFSVSPRVFNDQAVVDSVRQQRNQIQNADAEAEVVRKGALAANQLAQGYAAVQEK